MAPIKADSKAGAAMKNILGDEITIDPASLRSHARKLQDKADEIRPLITRCASLNDTVKSEASKFTEDGKPAPIFSDISTSVQKVSDHYGKQLSKFADQLESDARALVWIADTSASSQRESAHKVSAVDV